MRILCVIQRYHPAIGGSEILAKNFMDYLSKKHQVTVYTTNVDSITGFWNKESTKVRIPPSENYPVQRFDVVTPSELKSDENLRLFPWAFNHPGPFIPKLWENLVTKKVNFDLIFATAFPYDHIIPAYVASKKWKIPLIIAPLIHQELPELFFTSLRLMILKNSSAVVVLTNSEKQCLEKFGVSKDKIFIIPPGVKITQEKIITDTFQKENSISANTQIVLFIGLKSKVKGVLHLIEAMKQVWRKKPNSLLVLIGKNTEEYEEYILKQKSEIRKKILDLGVLSETKKNQALASCDVFVMPSKSESFGITYLEAWSFLKPVIGCKISSTTDVINDGNDGLLVEFGNVTELSKKILTLLEDENMRIKFGNNGRKKSEKFSWEISCKKFENLCKETIENTSSFH